MSDIVLLDTSIYLNVLDVPGWNRRRAEVLESFANRVQAEDYFLLPMATIWEAGNHIADLPDGGRRRVFATKFADDVANALEGVTPYRATHFPHREEFVSWLKQFPDYAQRSKTEKK